jgi:hypothetical protein
LISKEHAPYQIAGSIFCRFGDRRHFQAQNGDGGAGANNLHEFDLIDFID